MTDGDRQATPLGILGTRHSFYWRFILANDARLPVLPYQNADHRAIVP